MLYYDPLACFHSSHSPAEVILSISRATVTEMLAQQAQQALKPKGFSEVGSTEAEAILTSLDIQELRGQDVDPINMPPDTPACSSFDYAKYKDEKAGTADLLQHHQAQLSKLKVPFGRGNFQIYDTHDVGVLYR